MTEPYKRTGFQKQQDFMAAREWELEVEKHLGPHVVSRLDSNTELDFWVPEAYIEAKEKRQKLTERWHLLSGVDERDLFILDELSLRKALSKGMSAFFVLRDVPGGDRLFLAPAYMVASGDKTRRNRVGKGKLILDLRDYLPLEGLEQVLPMVMQMQAEMRWKNSECLSSRPIGQI